MKKNLILLFVFFSFNTYAQTREKNFIDQNYIEVTGKAEMAITPNQIYIKVLISEKDSKNKISVEELEKQMLQKLKDIGIDLTKDVFIKDITSNFKYYLISKSDVLISKRYQIVTKDAETTGKVFVELEKLGISNVSIEKLDNDKMEQYYKEVKIIAIKAAKDKAESLAIAIGQNIGKAIYIQEQLIKPYSNYQSNAMMSNTRISSENLNITNSLSGSEFEKINIEYSVLCRFELK